ncbi:unnamed protein product [Heligmosomoides polygyrus]|uniref:Transmembrane protein n=1 Tax=Heligmosomoides polygyrus TaxID=6339 RepID=A0A3P8D1F5_HELPZ|nr:unnamed protein product [Heligmosomoides polygyrus]
MAPSTCRLYKRLAHRRRGVATPGLPYFIKADNFDDTEHLPSSLLLQVRSVEMVMNINININVNIVVIVIIMLIVVVFNISSIDALLLR